MRLPIQPKTVKPKVTTIANTIQSRFILASSLFFAVRGRAPSSPFLQWQDRRDLSSLAYTASHFLEQENHGAIDEMPVGKLKMIWNGRTRQRDSIVAPL